MTSLFEKAHFVWGTEVNEDTTHLMDITDKISLVLNFKSNQKYSANKRQHCYINKKSEVSISWSFFTDG